MIYRKELLESCRALDEGRGTIRELIEDALPVTEATCEALQALCEQYREQRLQQLREEWEHLCAQDYRVTFPNDDFTFWEPGKAERNSSEYFEVLGGPVDTSPDEFLKLEQHGIPITECGGIEPLLQAARRYIIARDFNEFDPKRADMLWKLQNGGAL